MKVKRFFIAMTLLITLCAIPSITWANEGSNSPPQQPNLENIKDVNQANELIDKYNEEVDLYNEWLDDEYYKQLEEIDKYNEEVDAYNAQVDVDYNQAVQETAKANQEIENHNAAEEQRVINENAENEKAQAEADARNAEIDKENAAKQEQINQINKERQQQYDEDYAQYEKDLAIEKRIIDAGYESVEQYNEIINTRYNEPAKKSVEKNAQTREINIKETYDVQEGIKTGRLIPVHIEHHFDGTSISYITDFNIDSSDTILLKGIGALVETTYPGYANFYYNTDENHLMGYWMNSGSILYYYPSANVTDGWDCGDTHIITYKDSTNEYVWNFEDITIIYNYFWQPLKIYKTYNVPTKPILELENFTPIPYVEPKLINIIPADIWEFLPDPVKAEYLEYIVYPDEPEYLDYMDYFDPFENWGDPIEQLVYPNITPSTNNKNIYTLTPTFEINDNIVPLTRGMGFPSNYAYADTIEEEKIPMDSGITAEKNWALLNLILMIITILILIKFPHKEKDNNEHYKYHNNIVGVLLAIAAVIVFILTENIWLPMVYIDSWTIWMFLICLCGIIARFFSRTTKEKNSQ